MINAPDHLNDAARAEWDRLAPGLDAGGRLTPATAELLAALCVAFARWVDAERQLAEKGPIVKSPNGFPIQNPWLAVANKAMAQVRQLTRDLGIKPARQAQKPPTIAPTPAAPPRVRLKKGGAAPMMTVSEAAAWLETDAAAIAGLIKRGLPVADDGRIDPQAAAEWLASQGLADVDDATPRGTVRTLQQVADAFSVSRDTVRKEWVPNGMPGKRGHYDLARIADWKQLRSRDPGDNTEDEEIRALRRRKLELETEIRELEKIKRARLERIASADVVSRSEVEAELSQALIRIRRNFGTLPRLMMSAFPNDCRQSLTEELRRQIDKTLQMTADELRACAKSNKPLDDGIAKPKPIPNPKPRRKPNARQTCPTAAKEAQPGRL